MVSPQAELQKSVEAPAAASTTANTLVASHEWFGGDWTGRVERSKDISKQTTDIFDSSANSAIPEAPAFQGYTFETQKPETSANSAKEELSITHQIVNAAEASEIVSAIDDIVASGTVVTNEVEDQSEMSDLEDLLQNRLPIDLCEAKLPLRIALFGTPTGPRRLRIDAAHKTVPPPHVNLTGDKRREQQTAVTASLVPNQAAEVSSGGLDRALHFLQERTES